MNAASVKKRVVIMAGGTGGHVFPGLAVANELQKAQCEIHWLGTKRGIESRLVPAAGLAIHFIEVQGVRGRGVMELLKAPFRILGAIAHVRRWFADFKPNLVIGLGGYAAGPGGIAAWSMGIPLVIHEQNAKAGSTNKLLSRFAKRVLVAFENALPNSVCIGNPVRESIAQMPIKNPPAPNQVLNILVLGGSLGAQAINELVPKALADIPEQLRPKVIHQTGEKHLQTTQTHYANARVTAETVAFIDDMAVALSWADLVICRAGALTVAEISAAGVASILVPFPFAIDDHQTANAQWLVKNGAAILKQQRDLTAEELTNIMLELSHNHDKIIAMGKAAKTCAKPNATQDFARICLEVA